MSCLLKIYLFHPFSGRPQPQVRWLVNSLIIDDQVEQTTGDVTENRLMWPSVQRADLNSVFTCQVVNTQLVEPKETSFVLDLYCEYFTQLKNIYFHQYFITLKSLPIYVY